MKQTMILKFNPRIQKFNKLIHVIFAGGVLAGFVSLLILLGLERAGLGNRPIAEPAILKIFDTVINFSFFGLLLTGFLFSQFTPWSFFKFRWVIVKWIGALSLFAIVWFILGPDVSALASLADIGAERIGATSEYGRLAFTSRRVLLLLVAFVLFLYYISFFKPWGQREVLPLSRPRLIAGINSGLALMILAGSLTRFVVLERYRRRPVREARLSLLTDGLYRGVEECGIKYTVTARVDGGRILSMEGTAENDNPYTVRARHVLARATAAQKLNVDSISGATTSSRCLLRTASRALQTKNRTGD